MGATTLFSLSARLFLLLVLCAACPYGRFRSALGVRWTSVSLLGLFILLLDVKDGAAGWCCSIAMGGGGRSRRISCFSGRPPRPSTPPQN